MRAAEVPCSHWFRTPARASRPEPSILIPSRASNLRSARRGLVGGAVRCARCILSQGACGTGPARGARCAARACAGPSNGLSEGPSACRRAAARICPLPAPFCPARAAPCKCCLTSGRRTAVHRLQGDTLRNFRAVGALRQLSELTHHQTQEPRAVDGRERALKWPLFLASRGISPRGQKRRCSAR